MKNESHGWLLELLSSKDGLLKVPTCVLMKIMRETKDADLRFKIKSALYFAQFKESK